MADMLGWLNKIKCHSALSRSLFYILCHTYNIFSYFLIQFSVEIDHDLFVRGTGAGLNNCICPPALPSNFCSPENYRFTSQLTVFSVVTSVLYFLHQMTENTQNSWLIKMLQQFWASNFLYIKNILAVKLWGCWQDPVIFHGTNLTEGTLLWLKTINRPCQHGQWWCHQPLESSLPWHWRFLHLPSVLSANKI